MRTRQEKWNLSANIGYKFTGLVNNTDQRNTLGKRNVGWERRWVSNLIIEQDPG
jgi:hypothetical protein